MSGVLVDTCMWSLALRGKRPQEAEVAEQLTKLIDENRAKIIGPIRQEVLSGYSDFARYEKLRSKLQYFPNEAIVDSDYETAAAYSKSLSRQRHPGIAHGFSDLRCFSAPEDNDLYERSRLFKLSQIRTDLAVRAKLSVLSLASGGRESAVSEPVAITEACLAACRETGG